jgi:hypothetical protein
MEIHIGRYGVDAINAAFAFEGSFSNQRRKTAAAVPSTFRFTSHAVDHTARCHKRAVNSLASVPVCSALRRLPARQANNVEV